MAADTRVPTAEITGVTGAIVKRLSRKRLGDVPEPLGVYWHNRRVLKTFFAVSSRADRWNVCDENLKSLAHMATASLIGCTFCLDLGYFMAHNGKPDGLDVTRAREVPRWRDSDVFTPLERDVMEYAEAMSRTPPIVTDEMSARLLEPLGESALVELTAFIALSNFIARSNTAFGIRAQGFSDACGLPPITGPSADVFDLA